MADTASYPNLNPDLPRASTQPATGETVQNARENVANTASSTMDAIANHPITQSVTQGPVAESAKAQVDKTSNEFANVANSRRVPDHRTATGQDLTHYHSMFYNILSWENPRVTSIVYAALISFFFFTRYVPVLSMALKGTYIILGIIAASEVAGKLVFDKGLATSMRPRKYYTIPRENLERGLEDVEQLINFFVIEAQRIVFAENIYTTVTAFTAALSFYLLRKIVPTWGMGLIATTAIFITPLVYTMNKELIDTQLSNAQGVINAQATQVRDLAAEHTGRAAEMAKSTANQYTAKAQELIGQAKNRASNSTAPSPAATSPTVSSPTSTRPLADSKLASPELKAEFPKAPTTNPSSLSQTVPQALREEEEPLLAQ